MTNRFQKPFVAVRLSCRYVPICAVKRADKGAKNKKPSPKTDWAKSPGQATEISRGVQSSHLKRFGLLCVDSMSCAHAGARAGSKRAGWPITDVDRPRSGPSSC